MPRLVVAMSSVLAVVLAATLLAQPATQPATRPAGTEQTTASGLKIQQTAPGSPQARPGDTVHVHYTGTLTNGTKFDSSLESEPIEFELGSGQVIEGWEQGIAGMVVGEERTLTIPPELGYGSRAPAAIIPPNSTLVFQVKLVGLVRPE